MRHIKMLFNSRTNSNITETCGTIKRVWKSYILPKYTYIHINIKNTLSNPKPKKRTFASLLLYVCAFLCIIKSARQILRSLKVYTPKREMRYNLINVYYKLSMTFACSLRFCLCSINTDQNYCSFWISFFFSTTCKM